MIVLLKIIPITISGPIGSLKTYGLLDEGSTTSLINSKVAHYIEARGPSVLLRLKGISEVELIETKSERVHITISCEGGQFKLQNVNTVENLSLPKQTLTRDSIRKFRNPDKL